MSMNFVATLKADSETAIYWKAKEVKEFACFGIIWKEKDGVFYGEMEEDRVIEALNNKEILVAAFSLPLHDLPRGGETDFSEAA
jgi:hypothetical protein